jgi:hypothetical protein
LTPSAEQRLAAVAPDVDETGSMYGSFGDPTGIRYAAAQSLVAMQRRSGGGVKLPKPTVRQACSISSEQPFEQSTRRHRPPTSQSPARTASTGTITLHASSMRMDSTCLRHFVAF